MPKAFAIIGANYGDEGKGHMTDYLASKHKNSVVVRFNGGAQAGHTVVTPGNRRHVFSHVGSGAYNACPTYLSEDFIVNPIIYMKEIKDLEDLSLQKVFIHPNAIITTPYDMMLNQMVEEHRANKKHGSCGLGINETIIRNSYSKFMLNIIQLWNSPKPIVRDLISDIRYDYFRERAEELKITIPQKYVDMIDSDDLYKNFINDLYKFRDMTGLADYEYLYNFDNIIFEGAQGLLLSQDNMEFMPHLTRSSTGLKNIIKIANCLNLESIETTYITRAYLTRHGAGPLNHEYPDIPMGVEDLTNVPNPYQGTLRFAPLDIGLLNKYIQKDLKFAEGIKIKPNIAITCLDQMDYSSIHYFVNSIEFSEKKETFIKTIRAITDMNVEYVSYGPTRNDIYRTD